MSIREFFTDKSILITGASGFLGKALIEKLLRSCEGIANIYLLIRKKRGMSHEERLKTITDNSLFDTLKKQNPEIFRKLIPIDGDVKECNLGISKEDQQTLIANVNIIYHSAASVRFDDFLKHAILLNTRGTREVVNLASKLNNLVAIIHISTTYCNTDQILVEEKIYPPHVDWRRAIEIAENVDEHTLDIFSPKYIEPFPNTYTFSKSLSEHVVKDLCEGELPAVIFRPSVVISTIDDPVPGWIDNFNGPIGLLAAGGKGILRICYGDLSCSQDYVPVDVVVKQIIIATYIRAQNKLLPEIQVYNSSSGGDAVFTYQQIIDLGSRLTWESPFTNLFWYPSFGMTNNWYKYYITFLICHIIPAIFIDGLLKLVGRKPMLLKIQRKIYIANMAVAYFIKNTWAFPNARSKALDSYVIGSETTSFGFLKYYAQTEQTMYEIYNNGKLGVVKYLFHEEYDLQTALRNTYIMWILDRILKLTIFGTGCWLLIAKFDIFTIIWSKFDDLTKYWDNL